MEEKSIQVRPGRRVQVTLGLVNAAVARVLDADRD